MIAIIKRSALREIYPAGNVPAHEEAGDLDLIQAGFGRYGDSREYVRMDISNEVAKNPFFHPVNQDMVMAVLFERGTDSGYHATDITEILRELRIYPFGLENEGVELHPIYIEGDYSSAFGFMINAAADELLDFKVQQDSDYAKCVTEVLNDVEKETPDGIYDFCGVRTKIIR